MCGRAMFTIVASSTTISCAEAMTARARLGWTCARCPEGERVKSGEGAVVTKAAPGPGGMTDVQCTGDATRPCPRDLDSGLQRHTPAPQARPQARLACPSLRCATGLRVGSHPGRGCGAHPRGRVAVRRHRRVLSRSPPARAPVCPACGQTRHGRRFVGRLAETGEWCGDGSRRERGPGRRTRGRPCRCEGHRDRRDMVRAEVRPPAPRQVSAAEQDGDALEWMLPGDVRPRTPGNLVRPLVHGATYFARLCEVVEAAMAGDRIFFTDWRGDADERLGEHGPAVEQLLCEAARRGVEVRALLWRSHSDKTTFSAQENQRLGHDINDAGGEALLDQRVRRGGSHHQKLVVVRYADRPHDDVAFVGGIDLCYGRRDDARHQGDPQQQAMDQRYGDRAPWHDAMVEIRGPGICDVLETFRERWNDPTPLDRRTPYRMALQRAARMPRRPEPPPDPLDPPPPAGPHTVQVLRTYGAKRPHFPFAPGGERTVALAYARAFSRARALIYVEDQYLWSELVARTLADALRREPELRAVVVVPRYPDSDGRMSGPPNRLGQIEAMEVLAAAGGDRVAVYDLENDTGTPIYVHAKLCVVDDVWMTCGSDNFNRRSWTHDSEITCAVVDTTRDQRRPEDPTGVGVGARLLPRELRLQLWAEHLRVPADDPRLLDPVTGFNLWRERAESGEARARVHRPASIAWINRVWVDPAYRLVFDPDGRPLRDRLFRRDFSRDHGGG